MRNRRKIDRRTRETLDEVTGRTRENLMNDFESGKTIVYFCKHGNPYQFVGVNKDVRFSECALCTKEFMDEHRNNNG